MSKQISFNKEAFEKLLKGFNKAANAVNGTIGPKGKNVYFETSLGYESTNDGATIANNIVLKDKQEDAGAWIIRNITSEQNDNVGDGTTTVSVLTQAIIEECLKRPENPMEIRNSLKDAGQKVLKTLAKQSRAITKDEAEKVALISAEDKKIAKLISEIFNKLGEKAVINVEDSKTFATEYEIVDGYEVPVGFMSPYFINDKRTGKAVFNDVPVLVTEKKISNLIDISPLFEEFKKHGIAECVIVCDDIDDSMLGIFVQSKNMGTFKSVVIRASGDTLKDIEGVTGAHRISDNTGKTFKDITLEDLGRAKQIICDANKTLFLGNGKPSKEYANLLEQFTKNETNQYVDQKNKERIAKLRGGVATLRIAAPTDSERTYLRRKAEDAVKATQAALEEGVVEGGGMTLWRLAMGLEAKTIGELILKSALTRPLQKILENAGKDYTQVILNLPENQGYDAKADRYVDMFESGILDPTKVERCALENAISVSSTFITTFCLITEINETK